MKTRASFSVTFEIVTPESAEHGDAESRGYELEAGTLRDALRVFGYSAAECDSAPVSLQSPPRWFNGYPEPDYRTGAEKTLALHLPRGITPSSAVRIARLLKPHGFRDPRHSTAATSAA